MPAPIAAGATSRSLWAWRGAARKIATWPCSIAAGGDMNQADIDMIMSTQMAEAVPL